MAELPKLDDPKKQLPNKPPKNTNVFGEISGVNLVKSVNLNTNPLQIPGFFSGEKFIGTNPNSPLYPNTSGWNAFQKFLLAKGVVQDPTNNSDENKKFVNLLIKEFNSGEAIIDGKPFDFTKKFPENKITIQHINLSQTYHKKNDPKVQIDGWVGSQTSQLKYPTFQGFYDWDLEEQRKTKSSSNPNGNTTLPNIKTDAYIPIIWGNKRFITKVEDQVKNYYETNGISTLPSRTKFILYDEEKFPDIKFAAGSSVFPREWYTIGRSTEPNKSSLVINSKTEQQNKIKENLKSQTKISSDVLAKK
jgi:hypothetical protein